MPLFYFCLFVGFLGVALLLLQYFALELTKFKALIFYSSPFSACWQLHILQNQETNFFGHNYQDDTREKALIISSLDIWKQRKIKLMK